MFNDIVNGLLSLPNCALVTREGLFYQDLHGTVKIYAKCVAKLDKTGNECQMMKAELLDVLNTYHDCKKYPINSKNRK